MRVEHRALESHSDDAMGAPMAGKIVAKGLADELLDTGYLVVDGVDGRAHYVHLPPRVDLADYPIAGIVDIRAPAPSAADRAIASVAHAGVYRTAEHRAALQGRDGYHEQIVSSHGRRLEAERKGVVEGKGVAVRVEIG